MKTHTRSPSEIRHAWITLALIVVFSTVLGLASGCETLATPKTLDQRLAAAYSTHTAVVQAAGSSLAMGDISSAQGQDVLDLARRTKTILDGARVALGAGDIETAEGRLQLAVAVLAELQAYLRTQT